MYKDYLLSKKIVKPSHPQHTLHTMLSICYMMLSIILLLTACGDMQPTEESDVSDKSYTQNSYYEDPYKGDLYESQLTAEEKALIDQFLAESIGELEFGDLTDGSTIVAGAASGPDVVLQCTHGAVSVVAGVAVGTLATVFASSGVVAGGGGAAVTVPASLPLYATAGGLIGFGVSSSSWATCIAPLARMGMGLIYHGYYSAARGLQAIVFQARGESAGQSRAQSTTSECKSGSRKCNDMTGRYKNSFCNPLNRWRDQLGVNVHQYGICELGGLSCDDLAEIARLAAGCFRGRQAVTQRCFDGRADPGHKKATDYAERDFFSCVDLSFDMGCGDYSIEDRLDQQAQNSYPECL